MWQQRLSGLFEGKRKDDVTYPGSAQRFPAVVHVLLLGFSETGPPLPGEARP